MRASKLGLGVVALACLAGASAARASTISWTQWDTTAGHFTTGASGGSAHGVTSGPGIGVSYSGDVENVFANYPSWGQPGTFSGGAVDNAPTAAGGIVQLVGGNGTGVNTITFSQPVVDPVMAIWSLGNSSQPASFVFGQGEPFTIESGGPSTEYGGGALTLLPGGVHGVEGNGTIMFHGTFSSISWTNPDYEYWYGFTVGVKAAAVPLPAGVLGGGGLLAGLAGLKWVSRKRRA